MTRAGPPPVTAREPLTTLPPQAEPLPEPAAVAAEPAVAPALKWMITGSVMLVTATAAINVVRNLGGGIGVALMTTLLARRSQYHQSTLVAHVNVWDADTAARLTAWADYFRAQGADAFTAERQALGILYREVTRQAQVLAFADDFWVLFVLFCVTLVLLPLLRPVRMAPVKSSGDRQGAAPAPLPTE